MGIGDIFANFSEKLKDGIGRLGELIRSNLKIAACAGGAVFIILVLLVILSIRSRPAKQKISPDPQAELGFSIEAPAISPEDFFLPHEPNFVPDVLLEREPREGWTEEDARPFWTDPMEGNEAAWRRRIEEGVDGILERAP
jgi:hypothetical protein